MKRVLILLILILCSMPVLASELKISDIDSYVNGNSFSNLDDSYNKLYVSSGDEVELIIEVENLFEERTNIDIDGIDLYVSITEIGKIGNLIYESMNFELDAGEESEKRISFIMPSLDSKDYVLKIEVEGTDDNDKFHEDIEYINLYMKETQKITARPSMEKTTSKAVSQNEVTLTFSGEKENKKNIFVPFVIIVGVMIFLIILILLFLFQ